MKIDVRFDAKAAIVSLNGYAEKLQQRAVVKALNRTATTVRSVGARSIARELRPIKVGEVRKAITIKRAVPGNTVALVRASGRKRIPLTAFNARKTKTGVTVRIGGKTYTIGHAFLRQVKGGRLGVRIRARDFRAQWVDAVQFRSKRIKGGGYRTKSGGLPRGRHSDPDYPIAEIFAPGIPAVFVQREILQGMRRVALERFNTVIAQEVKFLSSKR